MGGGGILAHEGTKSSKKLELTRSFRSKSSKDRSFKSGYGWEADICMSFGFQLVQGRERTVRFWLLDFRNPKDGKKLYFVGAKPFIIPLSCFVFRSSPAQPACIGDMAIHVRCRTDSSCNWSGEGLAGF